MRLKYLFLLWAISVLVGCATNPCTDLTLTSAFAIEPSEVRVKNWNLLIGTWHGSQRTKDGGVYNWVMRHSANGLYMHESQTVTPDGKVEYQVEVGEWGMGGNIYFSIFKGWIEDNKFKPADPIDPINRDVYQIIELTDTLFRYKHLDSGEVYSTEKVADDFKLSEISL